MCVSVVQRGGIGRASPLYHVRKQGVATLQFVHSQHHSCSGCVVGQECGAVALPSEAVSGLVVAGDHGLGLSLGFALLWHGPLPLTPSFLQPASSKTPFLQVDPAQLIVYG